MTNLEITGIAKSSGPLTKRIFLGEDGGLISDGSACIMSAGTARRLRFGELADVAASIGSLEPHEAIALGRLRDDLPDEGNGNDAKTACQFWRLSRGEFDRAHR